MSQKKIYTFVENKIKSNYYNKRWIVTNKYTSELEYQLNWYSCLIFYFQEQLGSRCNRLIENFIEETNEFPINGYITNEDSQKKSLKRKRESSQRQTKDFREIIEISDDENIDFKKIKNNELDISLEDV